MYSRYTNMWSKLYCYKNNQKVNFPEFCKWPSIILITTHDDSISKHLWIHIYWDDPTSLQFDICKKNPKTKSSILFLSYLIFLLHCLFPLIKLLSSQVFGLRIIINTFLSFYNDIVSYHFNHYNIYNRRISISSSQLLFPWHLSNESVDSVNQMCLSYWIIWKLFLIQLYIPSI